MKIFKHIGALRAHLNELRLGGKSIGLIPTMGALHQGHIALVTEAKRHASATVCTIFVNPTQFNNSADLHKYPRTLDKDVSLLEEVQCDVLFAPEVDEIYPKPSSLTLDFGTLDKVMEGEFRPGHFSGVGLVVSKLFNIVEPDHAFFGQKDWQQFAIIRKLVEEMNFPVKLHGVPTFRESNGLALSSRNLRLTDVQFEQASVFFEALSQAKAELKKGTAVKLVKQIAKEIIESTPGFKLEYFELADSVNLTLLENVEGTTNPSILCVAGYAGEVRLIDNLFLD